MQVPVKHEIVGSSPITTVFNSKSSNVYEDTSQVIHIGRIPEVTQEMEVQVFPC